ncbi:MAG: hypothetical protein RLZZ622_1463, partial [Planctomycetota bacterium]
WCSQTYRPGPPPYVRFPAGGGGNARGLFRGCPGLGELGGLPTQAIGASIKDEVPASSRLNREDGASIKNQACKTAWPVASRWAACTAAMETTRFTMNSSLAMVRVVGLGVSLLICVESGPPTPNEERTPFS